MVLLGDGFDAYSTAFLPAAGIWTSFTGVSVTADVGRSGASGDNALFIDAALGAVLRRNINAATVDGVSQFVFSQAVQIVALGATLRLASIFTALSRFDLILTDLGALQVTQTSGGVLLGTICETVNGVVPIGSGGIYIAWKLRTEADEEDACQLQVSDQFGEMNPLVQGALLALAPEDTPLSAIQLGGGGEATGSWYVDDVVLLDGQPAASGQSYNGQILYNDDFLGNLHVQALYATGPGLAQSTGNTPWSPTPAVANYLNIDEHPPDEDATYNSADTAEQKDTYVYVFSRPSCAHPFNAIFALVWTGRLRLTSAGFATIAPLVRRVVTGTFAGDVVAQGDLQSIVEQTYAYFPDVLDRNPSAGDAPWTWRAFRQLNGPGDTEFGAELVA